MTTEEKEKQILEGLVEAWLKDNKMWWPGHLSYNDLIEYLKDKGMPQLAERVRVRIDALQIYYELICQR